MIVLGRGYHLIADDLGDNGEHDWLKIDVAAGLADAERRANAEQIMDQVDAAVAA
jgi:hypothetical protein